jgi:hypothetical protein
MGYAQINYDIMLICGEIPERGCENNGNQANLNPVLIVNDIEITCLR